MLHNINIVFWIEEKIIEQSLKGHHDEEKVSKIYRTCVCANVLKSWFGDYAAQGKLRSKAFLAFLGKSLSIEYSSIYLPATIQ